MLPTGMAQFSLPIPSAPSLAGTRLYGQWVAPDASEPGGLAISRYTRLTIGG